MGTSGLDCTALMMVTKTCAPLVIIDQSRRLKMTEFEIAQIAIGLMKFYRRGKGKDYLEPFEQFCTLFVTLSGFHGMDIHHKAEYIQKGEIEAKIKIPKLSEDSEKWLFFGIEELEISLRTVNALRGVDIRNIKDLYNYDDLLKIPNLGKVGIKEIKESMINRGFILKNI